MQSIGFRTWSGETAAAHATAGAADAIGRIAAGALMCAVMLAPWLAASVSQEDAPATVSSSAEQEAATGFPVRETLIAGYVAQPIYYRSDVHLERPDGTNVTLKGLGWDGDTFYFPIDGGVRSMSWNRNLGFMIDFLHNKAIARLGKGAHGSKSSRPIEEVEVQGTIKGQPAPARMKLTQMFERLEFTHGHNVLLFTPLLRLGSFTPNIRPYIGAGAGFALPHVEVWFNGEGRENRTNEYQLAGPAAQGVAGVELRFGRWSWFVEYKLSWASISGALTGEQSWKNFNMPGDLVRQLMRWWRGDAPRLGRFGTTLLAHQVATGAGYWFRGARKLP